MAWFYPFMVMRNRRRREATSESAAGSRVETCSEAGKDVYRSKEVGVKRYLGRETSPVTGEEGQ